MIRTTSIYINIILVLFLLTYVCNGQNLKSEVDIDNLELKLILAPDSLKIKLLNEVADKYLTTDPLRSIQKAEAALLLATKSKNYPAQSTALNILGQAHRILLSDFEKALEYCFRALKINETHNLPEGKAETLSAIGQIYKEVGNNYKAMEYYMQSLIIQQELHYEEGTVNTLNALGTIYLDLEANDKALAYHAKALTISENKSLRKLEANTVFHIGQVYKKEGKLKGALKKHKEALSIRKAIDHQAGIAESYTSIGEIYLLLSNDKQALQHQLIGIKTKKKLQDKAGLAKSYNQIGSIFIHSKEYERAIRNLELALEYGVQIQAKKQIRDTYEHLYVCHSALGNYSKALEYKDLFIAISEFIYSEESERKIAEMQTKYEIDKKENEIKILKQEQVLKEFQLAQQKEYKNFLIAGIIMVAVIALLSYYSFKVKKRSNIQLTETNSQINEKNKSLEELNATKDKFFSIISHDLKGPLNSLTSFSSLLINHTAHLSKEEIQMLAKDLDKSVKGLFSLLENLLEWSRSQSGNIELKPETLDLNDLINQSKNLLSKTAETKNIAIQTKEYYNIAVHADRNSINTVVRNLISNAIKFTPSGGEIKIDARESSNMVMISIQDNGVGISEEVIDRLFRIDKKHTTNGTSNEKGTGLGLILCKEFIEKNGGTIAVESQEGKGSVFSFTLPKAQVTQYQTGLAS